MGRRAKPAAARLQAQAERQSRYQLRRRPNTPSLASSPLPAIEDLSADKSDAPENAAPLEARTSLARGFWTPTLQWRRLKKRLLTSDKRWKNDCNKRGAQRVTAGNLQMQCERRPWDCGTYVGTDPLSSRTLLPRDGRLGDYRQVGWRSLLSGDESDAPSLDLTLSDLERGTSPEHSELQIRRRWDVDSVIARVTSLAVHRDGFDLAYRPPYLQRVTQNPYVRFCGKVLHWIKNQRLGRGLAAGGFNYDCHIFFPHLAVSNRKATHLTDRQQETWVDRIVLPALRESCPNDILQHHPRSFADIDARALARRELHPAGCHQAMDVRYHVPELYLERFWEAIERRCQEEDLAGFRNVLLVVSGHNLKLFTKQDRSEQVRINIFQHLDGCFRTEERYMPAAECWLDVGLEDTPERFRDEAVTLLHKPECSTHWNMRFRSPEEGPMLVRSHWFPWSLTRDAGSTKVEVLPTNRWRAEGGLAYNKAYNLQKDLFDTRSKGLGPFDLHQLEGLAYEQALLNRWHELTWRGGQTSYPKQRKQLLAVYQQVKQRVNVALTDSTETCFGVRQEYRITLQRFRCLTMACGPTVWRQRHRPYHVLRSRDVNQFMSHDINRWLFCLEALICQTQKGPAGLASASFEQQMVNGVMVSAIVRTLQSHLGAQEQGLRRSLWDTTWKIREERGEDVDEESATEDEPHDDNSLRRLGFDYRGCLNRRGLAWLPHAYIFWDGLPKFRPEIICHLGLMRSGFGGHLQRHMGVQNALQKEHRQFALFREYLQRSKPIPAESEANDNQASVLQLGAQLVLQSYMLEILTLLRQRHPGYRSQAEDIVVDRLSTQQAAGLEGFNFSSIEPLFNGPPHVIMSKNGTTWTNGIGAI